MTVFGQETGVPVDPYGEFDLGEAPVVALDAPKKRSSSRVIAGAGAVALAGLLGAYAFVASSPDSTTVMVAAGELEVGEPIEASDMRVVEVGSIDGVEVVTPETQGVLIGLTPRSPIPDGTVLNPGFFVTVDDAIPDGKVIVGAVVAPGAAATDRLRVGDPVGLIAVVSNLSDTELPTVLGDGEVWAIGPASERNGAASDEMWVSVLIDQSIQAPVAQAASTNLLWVTAVRTNES